MRVKLGIAIVLSSYVIGWPAIAVLGYISVAIDKTWILAVGGPLLYGFSHLVFMLGMYLAGADYVKILMRWATRVFVEKRMRSHPDES